jgi:hypothetical protein
MEVLTFLGIEFDTIRMDWGSLRKNFRYK